MIRFARIARATKYKSLANRIASDLKPIFGHRDRGIKTYRTLEGGTRPESCPWKAWTFDSQMQVFQRVSVEKGQIQRAPDFHPPRLIFGDLTPPPIPVSNILKVKIVKP